VSEYNTGVGANLADSFRSILNNTIEENEYEVKYWQGKFRGKIPKSVKNRIAKLEYIIKLQKKALEEGEKTQKKESNIMKGSENNAKLVL
jgi:predicted transcriptional regulator